MKDEEAKEHDREEGLVEGLELSEGGDKEESGQDDDDDDIGEEREFDVDAAGTEDDATGTAVDTA